VPDRAEYVNRLEEWERDQQRYALLAAIRYERCARSFADFVEAFWHVVDPAEYVRTWGVDCLCEYLQAVSAGELQNLVVNMPPRLAKSTVCAVLWPVWDWIEHPERAWLTASYAHPLAIRDSDRSRMVIRSEFFQIGYGGRFQLRQGQDEKHRYDNDQGGHRIATSVGAATTGEGGNICLVDDPHSVTEAFSEAKRERCKNWFKGAFSTRLNDRASDHLVIVGQRVHVDDLCAATLENDKRGKWTHVKLQMQAKRTYSIPQPLTGSERVIEQGELLCPERFDAQQVADLTEELGPYQAPAQLDQEPMPEGGTIFKRKYWSFYQRLPKRFDRFIISGDTAYKDTAAADWSAFGVWGALGRAYYKIGHLREKLEYPDLKRTVRQFYKNWNGLLLGKYGLPVTELVIEDKASGISLVQEFQRDNVLGDIVRPIKFDRNKVAHAHSVLPVVSAGRVRLPESEDVVSAEMEIAVQPWLHDYLTEMDKFPASKHDDQADETMHAITFFETEANVPAMAFG